MSLKNEMTSEVFSAVLSIAGLLHTASPPQAAARSGVSDVARVGLAFMSFTFFTTFMCDLLAKDPTA